MRHLRNPVVILFAVGLAYIAALIAVDARRHVFDALPMLAMALPYVVVFSLVAYVLRYLRWHYFLNQQGFQVPFAGGAVAYIAGFAFTASPGKAGELLRVRYYAAWGVPAPTVIACFVLERFLDLLVLLAISVPAFAEASGFAVAVGFVGAVGAAVASAIRWRRSGRNIVAVMRRLGLRRASQLVRIVLLGVEQISAFANIRNLSVGLMLGAAAWLAQCYGFSLALGKLGIDVGAVLLVSIPAAAMLLGAASMIPGGVGTTEAATVVLLTGYGAETANSVLGSIALRLGSIWFGVGIGFAAVAYLESRRRARNVAPPCKEAALPRQINSGAI
ncbi:MAG: lysylphosphatidylglycerol synthase transmembrane domain-containing protein [Hyphomicrobiaceae bacterium]|nr:lysylphosphatidylglycerol synthase transmembrane domain-containing protein [Hyphomicrobiaceae bacterium]